MSEGGFENPAFDPDESHWDDDDDGNDDQGDETTSFIPGSASTPSPFGEQIEIKTMQATCGWNVLCWDIFWRKRTNNRGYWRLDNLRIDTVTGFLDTTNISAR